MNHKITVAYSEQPLSTVYRLMTLPLNASVTFRNEWMRHEHQTAGLRIRNDLFRIRICYFWIADLDQDPTRVKGRRVIIMLVIAPPPAKTTILVGSGSGMIIPDPDPRKTIRIRIYNPTRQTPL